MKDDITIVIPAYNPDEKLIKVVKQLRKNEYTKVVVVNDGSIDNNVFEVIKEYAKVLYHNENRGKGQALKTGIKYCIENVDKIIGVITVDADGQHTIDDINKVYTFFGEQQETLVLGSRNFNEKSVPFRSKLGNVIFRNILRLKTGKIIKDTQTGLRAIPKKYLSNMLMVEGERYEYETNVLLYFIKNNIDITEVAIKTIYFDKNSASKFKALKDSLKICKSIFIK